MYDYIKGTLSYLSPSKVTIENHGIGYEFWVPLSNFTELCGQLGKEICLFVAFVVREDSHRLFGFIDKNEREVFKQLSEVSGIGPKTALSIIGHLSLKELGHALHEQDVLTLSKVPGIGKKTAERLILDMKDKLKPFESGADAIKDTLSKEQITLMSDALSALLNLGYNQAIAQPTIRKILKETKAPLQLSELITMSLKSMHSR